MDSLQGIVSGVDPEFYPQALLDQINSHLWHQHFFQGLQTYSKTTQLGQLQTANNHLTQYSPQIYQLAAMARPVEARNVIKKAEDAFTSFAATMESTAAAADVKLGENIHKLDNLNQTASTLDVKLKAIEVSADEKQAEWQADFTTNQTTRAEEHSEAQIERGNEFDTLLSEWKEQARSQTGEISSQYDEKLRSQTKTFQDYAIETMDDMKSKHESVLDIHKLVGRDSVAGGYQKNAGEEQTAANLWHRISMGALIAAITWLAVKYLMGFEALDGGTLNWPEIITASSLTAILLATAGYASSQSKMHRDNEKRMRSFALETKALDSFMASLTEDQQQKIKVELIRRMFGQQHNDGSGKAIKVDDATIKTMVEKVVDGVKGVV